MEMIRVNSLVKSSKPSTLPVSLRQEFILTRSSLPHHGWSRTACHVCNVVVPLTRPTSASLLSHDAAQRLMGFFFLIVQHHYYRSCTLWRHQKPVFSSCHAAQDCIHTLKFSGVVWRLIICFHSALIHTTYLQQAQNCEAFGCVPFHHNRRVSRDGPFASVTFRQIFSFC